MTVRPFGARLCSLMSLSLASCALPPVHRDGPADTGPRDAAVLDASEKRESPVSPVADVNAEVDAGSDPEYDPVNRNEDFATFRSLVPSEHLYAEWPMPDVAERSKAKPSYSATDTVVTDNVTKLRWQRVMPEIYPGCKARYSYVDRLRAVGSGCTWEEAKAYCSDPALAKQLGGGEWRLPTKIELESILDLSRVNAVHPLLDDFPIDKVWSATPVPNPDGLKLAWAVDFMVGYTMDSGRHSAGRARCVSSPKPKGGSTPAYDIANNTVRDRSTLLEWQRSPDSETRTWKEAMAYCESLELEGGGWHLPLVKELLTIVDPSRHLPAVYPKAFPLTAIARFWTASEAVDARNSVFQVDFVKGGSHIVDTFEDRHHVRCVR